MRSCMSETAASAGRSIQVIGRMEFGLNNLRNHGLRDSHTARDGEILLSQIDHNDFDFTAVIGINGAGRI